MAKLSQKEINEIKAALKEQADLQARINASSGDYISLIKEIKELNKNIASIKAQQAIQDAKAKKAIDAFNKAKQAGVIISQVDLDILEKSVEEEELKLKIITDELKVIQKTTNALADQARQSNKTVSVIKVGLKDIKAIGSTISKAYSWLDGAFKMDKSIKTTALQMGILSQQSDSFASGIQNAANNTIEFGIGIEKLAEMQGAYSEELGRTVTLSQKGLEVLGQMAAATSLGAEGAAKFSSDMDNVGLSVERTSKFVENTMNDSHKMGLNASKVIKTIASNIKILNKYNFKDGVKGLAKMAETATKLGVEMSFATGMAEKLFDIEGAVDMSAQLQVIGGEWAKLADPFKLMYMARNDMDGLTEALGKAAESAAHFNSKTGEFDISALEMHRLRKVAEQTGVSYEELAQAGKNAAKFTKIKKQMSFTVPKDVQEFLTLTSQLDSDGKATINIDGKDRLLKSLTESDKSRLSQMVAEKASLVKRAKDSQTFDESLTNLINQFKQLALPIVQTMDKELKPVIQRFVEMLKDPKTFQGLIDFAKGIGSFVSGVGKFIVEWPKLTAGLFVVFEGAKWFANGMALSAGFSAGQSGKGMLSSMGGNLTSGLGRTGAKFGGGIGRGAAIAGGLGVGGMLGGMAVNATTDAGSTMNILGNAAADGLTGAAMGSFLGPIGMAIGGVIGAAYGGITAYNSKPEGVNDAIIGRPIHDGQISNGLGSDFSKNRGIIQGGKITPIDNKDDLIAYKPNGPVDKSMKNQSNTTMKIEFGDIKVDFGDLKIVTNNGQSVSIELLKDPNFIRSITRMVHVETNKAVSGGVLNPNPKGR